MDVKKVDYNLRLFLKKLRLKDHRQIIMNGWYRFKDDLSVAPELEGVYMLSESNSEEGIVYIGRADGLYGRLLEHPDSNNPCLQRKVIRYFAFEETNNSEDLEKQLIDRYRPDCNRDI